MVDPAPYVEQCETDVCSCGSEEMVGHGECECAAYTTYARECALKGVILNWRGAFRCREYFICIIFFLVF